jgi:hypothetical protein
MCTALVTVHESHDMSIKLTLELMGAKFRVIPD